MSRKPPYLPLKFLRWFCNEDRIEEIEGDLTEIHETRNYKSLKHSDFHFAWNVIRSFRPINIKKLKIFNMTRGLLKHTILTGYRHMNRNKLFTSINILGLSVSIVVALFIAVYVTDELSYDNFHSKRENIYRILKTDSLHTERWAYNPPALAPSLKSDYPDITEYTRVYFFRDTDIEKDDATITVDLGVSVDTAFFSIFDFPIAYGSKSSFFQTENDIVISERIASIFFENRDPVGETLMINNKAYIVRGVIKVPDNSHLSFDFVTSLHKRFNSTQLGIWRQSFLHTYVIGPDNPEYINLKIQDQLSKYEPTNVGAKIVLQPLSSIHLDPAVFGQMKIGGNKTNVQIFIIAGIVLLVISIVNFMNLTMAKTLDRFKEVGIRKVIGSTTTTVYVHFLVESLIITGISMVVACCIFLLGLSFFNDISGKDLDGSHLITLFGRINSIVILILSWVGIAALASVYPCVNLAKKKSMGLIAGRGGNQPSRQFLSRGLSMVQFSIATILIGGTLIVNQQIQFILGKSLGWDRNNLVSIGLKPGMFEKFETFKAELSGRQSISNVTWVSELPVDVRTGGSITFEDMNPEKRYSAYYINGGEDMYETLKMESVSAYPFCEVHDDSKSNYVINEKLLEVMQEEWGKEVSPIGKELDGGVIVGVVKDFHWQPLVNEIGPILYGVNAKDPYGSPTQLIVRIKENQLDQGISDLESVYQDIFPAYGFDFKLVDDQVAAHYESEENTSLILKIFAVIGIFLSSLGLLGLAYQSAKYRMKEMGIRRVLGAKLLDLFYSFSKGYSMVILVSILVAFPLTYILGNNWLSSFAYRIDLNWLIFIEIAFLIALIVVSMLILQFQYVARAKPATILRDE